jgi:predicted ABC-type ATPase
MHGLFAFLLAEQHRHAERIERRVVGGGDSVTGKNIEILYSQGEGGIP